MPPSSRALSVSLFFPCFSTQLSSFLVLFEISISCTAVGMILPVAKLGTLALRTFCKPIASRLKKQAQLHPRFRQVIINLAQANHRLTTNMQRRIYGHATNVKIRPLNEEKAVQAAADLLGEFFVFSVAGAAIVFEVQRSSRSEARKEELRRQELEAIKKKNEDLAREVEVLKHKLDELGSTNRRPALASILRSMLVTTTEASTSKSASAARVTGIVAT